MKRKVRTDRNHVVYCITCDDTQKQYIGITVMQNTSSVKKTLNRRLRQHFWRAETQDKDWSLCTALRNTTSVSIDPITVVRGKKAAHELEVTLIDIIKPQLNTKKKA